MPERARPGFRDLQDRASSARSRIRLRRFEPRLANGVRQPDIGLAASRCAALALHSSAQSGQQPARSAGTAGWAGARLDARQALLAVGAHREAEQTGARA